MIEFSKKFGNSDPEKSLSRTTTSGSNMPGHWVKQIGQHVHVQLAHETNIYATV